MDTIELDPRLRHATTFLGRTPKMLIDGKMVGAASGKTFEVYNPATAADSCCALPTRWRPRPRRWRA